MGNRVLTRSIPAKQSHRSLLLWLQVRWKRSLVEAARGRLQRTQEVVIPRYIPVAKGKFPFLGHLPSLATRRLAFLERVREQGDIVEIFLGRTPAYVINDPRLAREALGDNGTVYAKGRFFENLRPLLGNGLGTSDGPFHLRQRRMVQPAFHHARPGYDVATLLAVIESRIAPWRSGDMLDIAKEMDQLSVALTIKTLFSSDAAFGDVRAVQQAIADFMNGVGIRTVLPSSALHRLPIPMNRRFDTARKVLDNALTTVIDLYRSGGCRQDDILSMLMDARDPDGVPMSDQELWDEAMSMLVAGSDTTGHVLGWIFHELGRNPEIERQLHDELDRVLCGTRPTKDTVRQLVYTGQIVNEALRVHNPGWILMRRTTEAVDLGRASIPAGTELLISLTSLHRDPRVYPDPMRFDPDRWLPGRLKDMPRTSFMPFGAGSHQCVGEQLARISMVLVLATVCSRMRLRPVAGHRVREVARGTMSADSIPMTITAGRG
ncbi:cytochrome P450 [Streptomyces sp. P1-3]|uniref:cytochrome P450 n=1 Tax=Streptomyces sp. P1-3 TaxID=3421658 RepID=UPI003D36E325